MFGKNVDGASNAMKDEELKELGQRAKRYSGLAMENNRIIFDLLTVVPGLNELIAYDPWVQSLGYGMRWNRTGLDRLIAAQKAEASLDFARHMRETYGIGKPVETEKEQ